MTDTGWIGGFVKHDDMLEAPQRSKLMHRRHTVNVPLSAENVSDNSLSGPRNPRISQSRDCCDVLLSKHWQGSANLMSKAEELGGVNFYIPLLHIKEFSDDCKLCLQNRTQGWLFNRNRMFLALSKTESSVNVGGYYTNKSLLISTGKYWEVDSKITFLFYLALTKKIACKSKPNQVLYCIF